MCALKVTCQWGSDAADSLSGSPPEVVMPLPPTTETWALPLLVLVLVLCRELVWLKPNPAKRLLLHSWSWREEEWETWG